LEAFAGSGQGLLKRPFMVRQPFDRLRTGLTTNGEMMKTLRDKKT
jgi:hypothetical protein